MTKARARPARAGGWTRVAALGALTAASLPGCSDDGPDAYRAASPIHVDVEAEARDHNGGALYEFVVDERGYVSAPDGLPAGDVMVTLTYTGTTPAPHSLVFEGLNGDQPVVAVDLPGSNNGSILIAPGTLAYFDGAPGNRENGYEGTVEVTGEDRPAPPASPQSTLSWATAGLEFVSAPRSLGPAKEPTSLELVVSDALPHSIAFEGVYGEQPLVAVDGPGRNRRTITLPAGRYVFFCAVPGHREAGMEGFVSIG